MKSFDSYYGQIISPLFELPPRVPPTWWWGHIPFMFVLFKNLNPRTYVDLGVHNGASLIAACASAKKYSADSELYGIDSWMGDAQASYSDGPKIYTRLKKYIDENYPNAKLIKKTFDEARQEFSEGQIDLLHIDGFHTYEAVKHDFSTWIDAMASDGVIIFHDTHVMQADFGVHKFWQELKQEYTTIEFSHSQGLGVLFLNPDSPKISAFQAIRSDAVALALYQRLVEDIAIMLPQRMASTKRRSSSPQSFKKLELELSKEQPSVLQRFFG